MKKTLNYITLICLLFISAILYYTWKNNFSLKETSKDSCIEAYKLFLRGNKTAGIEGGFCTFDTLINNYGSKYNEIKYAFFDMNGDGNPELHICSPRFYIILTLRNNDIVLWREESIYSKPLNNRAILYSRSGGAPPHIDYKYSVFNFYGEITEEISFEKYDNNEKDLYLFSGVEVTKDIWYKLTDKYLSIKFDQIKWFDYLQTK